AISKVEHQGKRKKQIIIEPHPDTLQRYGLTIEVLADRINQWSLEYRSGELDTARGAIILSGGRVADNVKVLQSLPIINTANAVLRLSDIADVRRGYQQSHSLVRYQGEQAVALMVNTSQKDNLFEVSEAIEEVEQTLIPTLPDGIRLAVVADMTPYISEQLDLLGTNAWQGLLIVIIILGLFLKLRLAFWVAIGIPVSLAGAIALMGLPAFDYSINDITLFGMILVLGILVDDAVVVGESIHQARQTIVDPKQAAWKGVEAVTIATVFGVLTTIAAFSPMLWIENELARVLAGFSAVVIFALLFSLIESKFILPTHLAALPTAVKDNTVSHSIKSLQKKCNNALQYFVQRIYQPLLEAALGNKIATLLLFCSFMALAYGLLIKEHIHSVFFPEIPGRYATLEVTMDQDVSGHLTRRVTD
ncbi:MAG: efflux RND transporter permease subunit, partial [Thiotrichales bacterium]|nr:efflux RND transporter permease subunit [Thiotrichales bacterium]